MSTKSGDIAFYVIVALLLLPFTPLILFILLLRGGSLNIERDPTVYPEQPLPAPNRRQRAG